MGMDCSEVDMINIVSFTTRMVKLAEYRKQLHAYLLEKASRGDARGIEQQLHENDHHQKRYLDYHGHHHDAFSGCAHRLRLQGQAVIPPSRRPN
jgi:hypothetical protein